MPFPLILSNWISKERRMLDSRTRAVVAQNGVPLFRNRRRVERHLASGGMNAQTWPQSETDTPNPPRLLTMAPGTVVAGLVAIDQGAMDKHPSIDAAAADAFNGFPPTHQDKIVLTAAVTSKVFLDDLPAVSKDTLVISADTCRSGVRGAARPSRSLAKGGQAPLWKPLEYLKQDETVRLRGSTPLPACASGSRAGWGGFTLHGHRLSSLYRGTRLGLNWLTNPDRAPSSCFKYSPCDAKTRATPERKLR